jgi:RNA polymerase sigma-70 factor, ECF subfamily
VDDLELVTALRRGDESAFCQLVDQLQPAMMQLALRHSGSRLSAEEALQDTWLAVLRGLTRFEFRSSLRTWIFSILLNRVRSAAHREWRHAYNAYQLPVDSFFSSLPVDPASSLLAEEALRALAHAISALPPTQRVVLQLREIEGWSSEKVRELLRVSPGNQRVILHRARTRLRRALRPLPGDH